jgi:hypothetical protein
MHSRTTDSINSGMQFISICLFPASSTQNFRSFYPFLWLPQRFSWGKDSFGNSSVMARRGRYYQAIQSGSKGGEDTNKRGRDTAHNNEPLPMSHDNIYIYSILETGNVIWPNSNQCYRTLLFHSHNSVMKQGVTFCTKWAYLYNMA